MLDETVQRLMRGDNAPPPPPADVSIDMPAYLPDDYIESQDAKLDVYKRLARFETPEEIEALRAELRDRFGPLPAPAEAFFPVARLRYARGIAGHRGESWCAATRPVLPFRAMRCRA